MPSASSIVYAIVSLLISVCLVATSSIGIKCINDNKDYGNKKEIKTNKNFLVFTTVCGVLGIILAIGFMVVAFKSG